MGIMTVNGVIDKQSLGVTTPHEHALIDIRNQYPGDRTPGSLGMDGSVSKDTIKLLLSDPYALRDNLVLDDEDLAIKEISLFAQAGGRSFVDVTPAGLGRNIRFLKKLASETGLNVIAACGYYTADAHPHRIVSLSEDEIADEFVCELMKGIDSTDICAGIIGEIGTSRDIFPEEIKVLRAAAIAHRKTDAPIMVHLYPWARTGIQVMDLMESLGVRPERVCLCHTDIQLDTGYMMELLKRGAYLEFDNFGKEFTKCTTYGRFPSDADRIDVLFKIIDSGYSNQLLVACDICLKNLCVAFGGVGYAHVLTGISSMIHTEYADAEELLNKLLIKNPAQYLDNPQLPISQNSL